MNHLLQNWPAILILIAGVSGAIGVYFSSAEQDKLQRKIHEQQDKLIKKSEELEASQKQNISLLEENSKLSREISNQLIGGDSWAFLSGGIPTIDGIANQPFMLVLNHVGQSPLRELNIEIYNIKFSDNTVPKSHTLTTIFKKKSEP